MRVSDDSNSGLHRRTRARAFLGSLGPLLGLIAVWAFFAILVGPPFLRWDNQRLMLLQTAVVGVAAVGATLIIITGGIDLSVGSTIALGTMVIALLLKAGATPGVAALGGVATGLLCGAAIGAMVVGQVARVAAIALGAAATWHLWTRLGPAPAVAIGLGVAAVGIALAHFFLKRLPLSPFIVTLGMWGALRGLAKGVGDNQPVYPDSIGWLGALMMPSGPGVLGILPPAVWMLIALAVLMAAALRATVFGRHAFAIGDNEHAARVCGVPVERTKLLVYTVAVGCAGLAGVLQFSYLSMGDPTTASGYELKVIAACVIGGASLSGGQGSVRGTLIGALIMTVVDNGCTKLELDNWVQEIVTGGIIITAVALDQVRHGRGERQA